MPTRNVNLTPELDAFVAKRVESGRYANASEVVRIGLRLLEERELENEAKMAALKKAIGDGLASGLAEPDVLDRLIDHYKSLADKEQNVARV